MEIEDCLNKKDGERSYCIGPALDSAVRSKGTTFITQPSSGDGVELSGGIVKRWLAGAAAHIVSLFAFFYQKISIVGVELVILIACVTLVSQHPPNYRIYLGALLAILLWWEVLYRFRVPVMPWNRACSGDSEGEWKIGLARSLSSQPLTLKDYTMQVVVIDVCSYDYNIALTWPSFSPPFTLRILLYLW